MKSLLDAGVVIQEMTVEQSKAFMALCMQERSDDNWTDAPKEWLDEPIYRIIGARLNAVDGLMISPQAVLFNAILADGNPGRAVMYAYTMKEIFERTRERVTLESITTFFPMGFPSDEALNDMWDSQKDGGCNILDLPQTWTLETADIA